MSLRPTGSYAAGKVRGSSNVGGLGLAGPGGSINNSYFDAITSGQMGSRGRTTLVLQLPITYTGIYANWNVDLDNDSTTDDDPWDFGATDEYPVLQVDFDGDGGKSWQEFGPQPRPGVFVSREALSLMEETTGAYTVVLLTIPTTQVTVTPRSRNPAAVSVNGGALMFMPENWDTAQTVTVFAMEDADADDEVVLLSHAVVSNDPNYGSVTSLETGTVQVRVTDDEAKDYDIDDDNLIEVESLQQLNAIRYDLDGDGIADTVAANYTAAFPRPAMSMGCPATCTGYELMASLDFNTNGDDGITADDGVLAWGGGRGWQPIGTMTNRFTAEFNGNGHTISHLFIHSTSTDNVGLFGFVGTGTVIRGVGLVGVDVTGDNNVGGLAGFNDEGTILASYEPVGLRDNHT